MMSEQEVKLEPHAIQTAYIAVKELYIQSNVPPSPELGVDAGRLLLTRGHTAYDADTRSISVRATIETNSENESPYDLRVSLVAEFQVDEERFPKEHIEDWARNNAIFIMYPFFREHVYALTLRAGFAPALLSLVEIPTYQIPKGQ